MHSYVCTAGLPYDRCMHVCAPMVLMVVVCMLMMVVVCADLSLYVLMAVVCVARRSLNLQIELS